MKLSLPLIILFICVAAIAAPAFGVVSIRYDAKVPTLEFATEELTNALHAAKQETAVTTFDQPEAKADGWTIIIGLQDGLKDADPSFASLNLAEEGFAIRPFPKKKLIYVIGADPRGAMYGELDITERIEMGGKLSSVKAKEEKPSVNIRALKLNLPGWDTFDITPEWKDDWDWFLKPDYWRAYFRMMARNRYNVSSLWHCHPYHWMVKIPKYPEATTLSDEQMEQFHKAFTFIFAEAARHGIDTYLITWNIHYSPGLAKKYNLVPTGGQDTPVTRDYMREAIKAVLREYPGLTGIGTCPGENMASSPAENEAWLMDTYVPAIMEVRGPQKFIHRYWGSEPKPMQEVFAAHYPGKVYLDLKYNGESMYSDPAPHFVDPVWLNQQPRNYDILWHLRNDDLYLFRWGDSSFARSLLKHCTGPGIAGYVTGSEYERPGPDRLYTAYGKEYQTWYGDFEKHWYRYMLWGKLAYNIDLPDSYFRKVFASRFGPQYGPTLLKTETVASKIMPLVESFHWNYMNFDWAGESCENPNSTINTARDGKGQHPDFRDAAQYPSNFNDIREWIFNWTISDDDYLSIPEYVGNLMAGCKKGPGEEKKRSPIDVANALDGYANQIESGLKQLNPDPAMAGYKEAVSWNWDLQLLAYLGHYYADKTRGGTDLLYYLCTGDKSAQQRAIVSMTKCKDWWLKIVDLGEKVYTFPKVSIYPDMRWSKYLGMVDQDIKFCQDMPVFSSFTSNRSVWVPKSNSADDLAKIDKEIESGIYPTKAASQTAKMTEIDTAKTGAFSFWLNTMTNRRAGFVNLATASGGRKTGIGYFTYPLSESKKRWVLVSNDFGSADKIWYGGKLIFDSKTQNQDALKKGVVFLRDDKAGPLIVRCDGAEGKPWGCSLRHEYRDTFAVSSETQGSDTIRVTVTNGFPQATMNSVKLTAVPWASGWEVTPGETTVDVRKEKRVDFVLKQTDKSSAWSGLTVNIDYGGERQSVSDFTPLATLNTVPARQDGDGFWRGEQIDGKWAMITRSEDHSPFIYYDVKDSFLFDIDKDVTLSVEYYDPGTAQEFSIDYDSHLDGPGEGAFHRVMFGTNGDKGWHTQTIKLARAMFKNREQGRADIRICGPDGATIRLGRVEIADK